MKTIADRIKSNETDKTVNVEKQNRHIRGTDEYAEGRSYLLDGIDPQELVDRYHGTGDVPTNKRGEWKNKEVIVSDRNIGVDVDQDTGNETVTNRFTIHYSKTGTHVIPAERRKLK